MHGSAPELFAPKHGRGSGKNVPQIAKAEVVYALKPKGARERGDAKNKVNSLLWNHHYEITTVKLLRDYYCGIMSAGY
jgi:hypothetical protein